MKRMLYSNIFNRQFQTTQHDSPSIFLRHPLRALQCTTRSKFCRKIFLENFAKFDLQNSDLPSIFLRSCESLMTIKPWRRKKKKLIQTCCLMRKSSLKHHSRLYIHQQNEAVSGAYFDLLNLQELPFVPGEHYKMDKFLDIVGLKKGNHAKALGFYCHHLV